MDDHRLYEIYKYRRISDRIATAGQPTEAQLAAIAKAGCTTVINLGLHDTAYALSDERSLVESLGIKYVYIPVRWDRPDKAALVRFCDVLEAHEDQDVFIHCKANRRVALFIALDRIVRQGWQARTTLTGIRTLGLPRKWQKFIRGLVREHTRNRH